MPRKIVRDWKTRAYDIGIGLDITWIRHIRNTLKCTQQEAEDEFRRAVNARILRCDSVACQLFMRHHGMPAYIFHSTESK
jgi:hypothetical protein